MAKLDWQKCSRENQLRRQWVVNPPIKIKSKKSKKKKIKRQTFEQAITQENTFLSGKYQGHNIGKIFDQDKNYFIWILENRASSIVAQQMILYFTQNPKSLEK
jgi:hypothetical protein